MALALASTLIHSGKTLSVISSFGHEVVMASITQSATSIKNVLSYVSSNNISQIDEELRKLDLEFTINVIHRLVIEQNNNLQYDSIKVALKGVNDILEIINDELLCMKQRHDAHVRKYFNSWRYFYYDLTTIKTQQKLLLTRYDILIKLLQIYNK